ncbi:hypothetical protein LZZ90_01540 [Flavobacterium sp. SM15]|uniref:hypothetical protein n=1 Tax=Flavobacterium sp. SM15 TaxID=2908005 RepID=UPI001EDA370F|nr:hypothetical protein [Flavobacterium sp. SM15]MCG2610185.1 hypothetical protein [Flavobacterium sp. SM15]
MGITDSNLKDFFKQTGIALFILAIVVLMIFNSVSNLDKKQEKELEMLNSSNQFEQEIVIGRVYEITSGKNYEGAKFVYYYQGKKKVAEDGIAHYDESLVGRFFRISNPSEDNHLTLYTDYEVTDTIKIKNAGFTSKTKFKFDISTGKYIPYKKFQ